MHFRTPLGLRLRLALSRVSNRNSSPKGGIQSALAPVLIQPLLATVHPFLYVHIGF